MKTHDHDNAHSAQRRAVAQQAEHGDAGTQLAQAGPATFDHHVNHSPRLVAQRQLLGAAFGPVAQREPQGLEEELPVQGKALALHQSVQREAGLDDEEPALQAKQVGSGSGGIAQAQTEVPAEANLTGMPSQLKSGVEALSGMDMSDVRVHRNSDKPAQLNALAYAQGSEIHLGPGQERHLPHEAWHVVQQRQGRVQATMQMAGVGVNDDVGLEEEADLMGEKAESGLVQLKGDGKRQDRPPKLGASGQTPAGAPGKVAQLALMEGVGDDEYRSKAGKNLEFEAEVGSTLAADAEVMHAADRIRLYSGAPANFASMTVDDRRELEHLVGPIGGARDLREDRNTLDANVLATHLLIDRPSNRDPDAPDPTRRQNRFNRVMSEENPIYPWNIHDFDMALHEVDSWDDYPPQMAEQINSRWETYRLDDEKYALTMSLPSLGDVIGLSTMDAKDFIGLLSEPERKTFLYDILGIKWSTSEDKPDEVADETPGTDNPLGPQFRQHNTGNRANVVRAFDAADPAVAKWVAEALLYNKPIISGPSGHTLRYLNHWSAVRGAYTVMRYFFSVFGIPIDMSQLPTLEVARFVMMANLMPPKDHHSYHEIMGASIGISDGVQTLSYNHPDSYADLNTHAIGRNAFQQATLAMSKPNTKPLPNPWAIKPQTTVTGWPPQTPQDLVGLLYRYASNAESAELILQGAGSRLRIGAIPLVEAAAVAHTITTEQKEFILDTIRRMG